MELYVTEISKYVIDFFMLLYVLVSFMTFRYKTETKRKWLYTCQIISMFVVQISCFIQIIARTGEATYLFFFAFQIIIFVAVQMLFYVIYPEANRLIINNSCLLLMISMIILTRLSYDRAVKQFFIMTASFIIGFFVPEIIFRFEVLKKFTWIYAAVGFISISAVLLAVLNVNGYFTVPALTPILFSIAVVLSIMLLHKHIGVYSMAVGVLAGGVMQILFQYPIFHRLGYDLRLSINFRNSKFRRIMLNWIPVVMTSSIFFINQQISMRFASALEEGSSSAISYALVFWQLPFGIFAASINTVLFPQMSKEGATEQFSALTSTLTTGIVSLMALLIPSSLIMYFLGYDIISIGMKRGSFTVENTAMAAFVLQGYAWGLLGTGAFNFIQRYFYSLNNYRKPFFYAALCAAMDVVLSLWLKETPLRVAGLAWANTISFTAGTCLMLLDIKLRSPELSIMHIIRQLLLILAAMAAGMVPVLIYLHFCGTWWQGRITLTYFGVFILVCMVFSAVVLMLYKVLGVKFIFSFGRRKKKSS